MSCELFCCELSEILSLIVEDSDGALMHRLMSILDSPAPLDNYLAGYFEKVMEVLLRNCTKQTIDFLNYGGVSLFQRFMRHISNYSVMQIIQRLLLPHIPFSQPSLDQLDDGDEDTVQPRCDWSTLNVTCESLCNCFVNSRAVESTVSHSSDLLITVLQLSPPESSFTGNLCAPKCLDALFPTVFQDDVDSNSYEVSIAALAVLESLTTRLGEAMSSWDLHVDGTDGEEAIPVPRGSILACMDHLRTTLWKYFNRLELYLRQMVEMKDSVYLSQDGCTYRKLGMKTLQLVKFIEAIVRLADSEIDERIIASDILRQSLALMLAFEKNSLLHLSLQRIFVMIIDGGERRGSLQRHLMKSCDLVQWLSDFFKKLVLSETKKHCPVAGHIIYIVQVPTVLIIEYQ
jgi:hypothetical protein